MCHVAFQNVLCSSYDGNVVNSNLREHVMCEYVKQNNLQWGGCGHADRSSRWRLPDRVSDDLICTECDKEKQAWEQEKREREAQERARQWQADQARAAAEWAAQAQAIQERAEAKRVAQEQEAQRMQELYMRQQCAWPQPQAYQGASSASAGGQYGPGDPYSDPSLYDNGEGSSQGSGQRSHWSYSDPQQNPNTYGFRRQW